MVLGASLLALALFAYVRSERGSAHLLRLASLELNQAIEGLVTVERLELFGNRVVLHGATLWDPDGRLIAQVKQLSARISLAELFRRRLRLYEVKALGAQVHLQQGEPGLNLVRAVRSSRPRSAERKPGGLELEVTDFELVDGAFSFEPASARGLRARVQGLFATGNFALHEGGRRTEGEFSLQAGLAEPLSGPLAARIHLRSQDARFELDTWLEAAGVQWEGRLTVRGSDWLRVESRGLFAPPEALRAFFPRYPMVVPVVVSGVALLEHGLVTVDAKLSAGSANGSVSGTIDRVALELIALEAEATGLDLLELLGRGPRTRLDLFVQAQGGLRRLEELSGFAKLAGTLPGGSLNAQGRLSLSELKASASLESVELEKLAETISAVTGSAPLPMRGHGGLMLSLQGSLRNPSLELEGGFTDLGYASVDASSVSLLIRLAELTRPLDAFVSLNAERARLPGRVLEQPKLLWEVSRGELTLESTAGGITPIHLSATGRLDPDRRGIALRSLTLRNGGPPWELASPAHLRFDPGTLWTDKLRIRSGEQVLALDGGKRGELVNAELKFASFDLTQLPDALVDPRWRLAGVIDGTLRAHGKLPQPGLELALRVRHGGFRRIRELTTSLQARVERERLSGKAFASFGGFRLSATADLPLAALRSPGDEPLSAELIVEEGSIEEALLLLELPIELRGQLAGRLVVQGSSREPRVELGAQVRALQFHELPPADLALEVQSSQLGALEVQLRHTSGGHVSRARLLSPWTLAQLVRSRPFAQWAQERWQLELALDELALPLGSAAPFPALSAKGSLFGPPRSPQGQLDATVSLAETETRPFMLLRAQVQAAGAQTRVALDARRDGHKLASGELVLKASLDSVASPRVLPFELAAQLEPSSLDLVREVLDELSLGGPRLPLLEGTVAAKVTLQGTLAEPRLAVSASIDRIKSTAATAAGTLELDYDYQRGRHGFSALLKSGPNGKLELVGTLLRGGGATSPSGPISEAPFEASLRASKFDLALLSGLLRPITEVGGTLDGAARLEGPLGAPRARGELTVHKGRLVFERYGEYQEIDLQLVAEGERLELTRLTTRAGSGLGRATIKATRQGAAYALQGKVELEEFPIISEDQLIATVTSKGQARGAWRPGLISLTPLSISEAHVELPDVKRKNLQPLDPPRGVRFVRNGIPVSTRKRGSNGVGGSGEALPSPQKVYARFFVDAPRNVWVKGYDLDGEVGFSDGFRVEIGRRTELFGQLEILRGRTEVLGRRFEIQEGGTLTFAGPSSNPEFDVTGKHISTSAGATLSVTLSGPAKSLTFTPTSDPPMSETEIYTLLATGRRTLRSSGSATETISEAAVGGAAATVFGTYAANQLKGLLSEALPIDVLFIEAGESGFAGTRIEAGSYFGTRAYVGYRANTGARPEMGENSNAVILEYQLSRRWSVEAEWGDAPAGGVELFWRKEY